ncbi:MAG: NADH-quinone oxidoreductase subunit NuoH [Planctomycetes bacterium]|jgi:NADH-quinone oxidoreductase subunit H|nr:NADH-quinone oxidoreductase subunit NuoH [Planctomycetota bacterium]
MPLPLVWLIKVVLIYGGLITVAAAMSLAERKVSAWIQWRVGPNRVGPWGLLQPVADGVKFIFKEELVPEGANQTLFRLAPILSAVPPMLAVAVIPFAGEVSIGGHVTTLSIADLDISTLYVVAIGGLGIYGVILGGWSSNSKYSLLGGLRASAQMVSYELSLLLSILVVVVLSGTLDLRQIVNDQAGPIFAWNIFALPVGPIAFLLFVIATFAETNRHPFDFAECEPELVGGFHTEYSSMKFALFFLGEYCAMTVMACLTTVFFLGGGNIPWWPDAPWLLELTCFLSKMGFFLFLFLWVRWTLPRFRFDQLMALGWKVMLPIAIANVFVTGALLSLGWFA